MRRPVDVRLQDWREVYNEFPGEKLEKQVGRCMDCGIPFCHNGCSIGNLIPEWNDLVWHSDWQAASEQLHAMATSNFPEFTGRAVSRSVRDSLRPGNQCGSRHD